MPITPETFKRTMSRFATGVTVVTTRHGDVVHGMTVNAFCSVSLDPPLVLVSIAKSLRSHDLISSGRVFAVNILGVDQMDLGERFAGRIPDLENRFAGLPYETAVTGSPLIPGALAWVDCRLWASYDGGDHTLFVGEVVDGRASGEGEPLLYYESRWSQLALEGPLTANPWPGDEDG